MIAPLDVLTVDDVVRAGACRDGVMEWYEMHGDGRTCIPVADALSVADSEAADWIRRAAGLSGGDVGDGDGDGGYGDGDGDGGYGYGDGDGDGGYGDVGYGGDGDGDGGYGDVGYGYGDGGYGDAYGGGQNL